MGGTWEQERGRGRGGQSPPPFHNDCDGIGFRICSKMGSIQRQLWTAYMHIKLPPAFGVGGVVGTARYHWQQCVGVRGSEAFLQTAIPDHMLLATNPNPRGVYANILNSDVPKHAICGFRALKIPLDQAGTFNDSRIFNLRENVWNSCQFLIV